MWMATLVGHDGTEGYHSQELIDIACKLGYAVTEIQRTPVAQNPEDGSMRMVEFREHRDIHFGTHMCSCEGVLLGRVPFTNKPHCVAWSDPYAYDPAVDQKYSILDEQNRPTDTNFVPMVFLRIEKL
jgi:hypothetical protein